MKLLILLTTLIFSISLLAQDRSLEMTSQITFMAHDMGSVLEHWQPGLRRVWPKDWISVPTQKVVLTQVSETEVEVQLKKPFKFFLHSDGEVVEKTIERFIFTGSPETITKILSIEEGSFRTSIDSRRRNILKLINTMFSEGANHRMAALFDNRAPLPIYRINQLNFDVKLSELLDRGHARVIGVGYGVDIISHSQFSNPTHNSTLVNLKYIGRAVDIGSGLVQRYLHAFQKMKARVALFQQRNWWEGLKVESQRTINPTFAQYENIEPLRLQCHQIFQ